MDKQSCVLLYNLKGTSKGAELGMMFSFLGYRIVHVEPPQYNRPVGQLVGVLPVTPSAPCKENFSDEMLVIYTEDDEQLEKALFLMKQENQLVNLKAVLTEMNRYWTSLALHHELGREHEALHKK